MEGDEGAPIATHAEVLEAVQKRSLQMQTLVQEIVATIDREVLPKVPPMRKISTLVPEEYLPITERKDGNVGTKIAVALGAALTVTILFNIKSRQRG